MNKQNKQNKQNKCSNLENLTKHFTELSDCETQVFSGGSSLLAHELTHVAQQSGI
ncbi:MAG: eCIS core domain-containing protein [Thainema sp.]